MMEVSDTQSESQHQLGELQEELMKAKEEKSRALQELEEATKNSEILEVEAARAKESEKKMLESLVSQTKQLEQTKMSLEEAKLEIRSLHEFMKTMKSSSDQITRNPGKPGKWDGVPVRDEIGFLRTELKLALEAEEKSKKAMDDLALALKEVSTDSNRVKESLSKTQLELENARAEAGISKERLKLEAEESFTAWIEKEKGFIKCMKISEQEITSLKQENNRLVHKQRLSREEISCLRDILKQAVNESTIVKEALEIARNENSQLKDILSEKNNALQIIRQEYECLKISEAAAVDSVEELKGLLAATSSTDSNTTANSFETGSFRDPEAEVDEVRVCKSIAKFPSEHWRRENRLVREGRRYSLGESGTFEGSIFDLAGSPEQARDLKLAISVNDSSNKARSSGSSGDSDDRRTVIFKDLDHIDRNERDSPAIQKKRRQILRRFGDLLRRNFTSSAHHA